tara:strand:+ start:1105 stop:1611 length:507 start_codon:yes stop_codon:yes gene_type:complete
MKIIGVCGAKRAGKDTFYQLLLEAGHDVKRMALADAIKRDLAGLPGVIGASKEQARELYQVYGCLARDLHGDRYWINRLESELHDKDYDRLTRSTIVITDVRFQNEAQWIKDLGGTVVIVEGGESKDQHRSEQEWRSIEGDYRVVNKDSMADYRRKVGIVWRDIHGSV